QQATLAQAVAELAVQRRERLALRLLADAPQDPAREAALFEHHLERGPVLGAPAVACEVAVEQRAPDLLRGARRAVEAQRAEQVCVLDPGALRVRGRPLEQVRERRGGGRAPARPGPRA